MNATRCLVPCVLSLFINVAALAQNIATTRPAAAPPTTSQAASQPARPTEPVALARWFVDRLVAGEFVAAFGAFDETMSQHLPAAKLSAVWSDVGKASGKFQDIGEPTVRRPGELTVVVFPATWEHNKLDIQVTVNANGTVGGLFFRPTDRGAAWQRPDYADPAKFSEIHIIVGKDPYRLNGELCLPRGVGPFPGVVLLHGSGPQDRDETIGPNKPFRDIAWGLASRGIAVLRYDKRTLMHGEKVMADGPNASNEVIVDALLALKLLRSRPQVDKSATFIIGHSLGGCLAPVIARADTELAGIAILSGTLRDLDVVVLEQLEYMANNPSRHQEETKKTLPGIRADIEAMRAGKKQPGDKIMFAPVSYWQDINAQLGDTGAKALRDFPGRVLILGGGRDIQITKVDFDLWRSAAGDRKGVTFRWLPAMNHLFVAGTGPGDAADYEKPGHVDVSVIDGLASWIRGGDFPEAKAQTTSKPTKP